MISKISKSIHLMVQDRINAGKQHMIVNGGNHFLLSEWYLFVQQVESVEERRFRMLVLDPNLEDLSRSEPQYVSLGAHDQLDQFGFKFLEVSGAQVVLSVNHVKPDSPFGDLYVLESPRPMRFHKVLDANVRAVNSLVYLHGECEFESVVGLRGVFVANSYQEDQAMLYASVFRSAFGEQAIADADVDRKEVIGDPLAFEGHRLADLRAYRQTLLTFDNGYQWTRLSLPAKTADGRALDCAQDRCALHLHSYSSNFGPIYSSPSAPGLLIANGNVGAYLSENLDDVNTYISRNAGVTWEEVLENVARRERSSY